MNNTTVDTVQPGTGGSHLDTLINTQSVPLIGHKHVQALLLHSYQINFKV